MDYDNYLTIYEPSHTQQYSEILVVLKQPAKIHEHVQSKRPLIGTSELNQPYFAARLLA